MSTVPSHAPILWQHPSPAETQLADFFRKMVSLGTLEATDDPQKQYERIFDWSIRSADAFWSAALDHLDLQVEGSAQPVRKQGPLGEANTMFGTQHFPRLRLSFAANLLRKSESAPESAALVSLSESRGRTEISYRMLKTLVCRFAGFLRDEAGVKIGDRVVGYVPNSEEAVVAMLAAESVGAVWSSCSPDFGVQGVVDRFGQIEPKVIIAGTGYVYGGKYFSTVDKISKVASALPSLEALVLFPFGESEAGFSSDMSAVVCSDTCTKFSWQQALEATPSYERFQRNFNDPLYIMYSSGTTGVPKCIVHGVGGTLLQHAKELVYHCDLKASDKIFYYTTCGWMMWNWLVSSLFTGATVVLYDGSPLPPNLGERGVWELVADEGVTHFGTSPKFMSACMDRPPPSGLDLSALKVLMSTGAPLLPEHFDWVYESVRSDLQLASICGGTDIISCFMLGNPLLPVRRGELQAFGLGMNVAALGPDGEPVVGEKGELACLAPFPSMPVSFWNDASGEKYKGAYFEASPNVWHHGDFVEHTGSAGKSGGVVVYGRSDATLNPGGVRIGTAEIYRIVESEPWVADSLVVGRSHNGDVEVVLFVQPADGQLTEERIKTVRSAIRKGATPRHMPKHVFSVPAIPYTISGKKVEIAVTRLLQGIEPKNLAAMKNPDAIEHFRNLDFGSQ